MVAKRHAPRGNTTKGSFSDGFGSTGTTTSIVSELVAIDVTSPVQAFNCSGDFEGPCVSPGDYARDFNVGAVNQPGRS